MKRYRDNKSQIAIMERTENSHALRQYFFPFVTYLIVKILYALVMENISIHQIFVAFVLSEA